MKYIIEIKTKIKKLFDPVLDSIMPVELSDEMKYGIPIAAVLLSLAVFSSIIRSKKSLKNVEKNSEKTKQTKKADDQLSKIQEELNNLTLQLSEVTEKLNISELSFNISGTQSSTVGNVTLNESNTFNESEFINFKKQIDCDTLRLQTQIESLMKNNIGEQLENRLKIFDKKLDENGESLVRQLEDLEMAKENLEKTVEGLQSEIRDTTYTVTGHEEAIREIRYSSAKDRDDETRNLQNQSNESSQMSEALMNSVDELIDTKLTNYQRKTKKEIEQLQGETFNIQEKEVENLHAIQKDLDHLQENQRKGLNNVSKELSGLESRTNERIDELVKKMNLRDEKNQNDSSGSKLSETGLKSKSDLQYFRDNIHQLVREEVARQTQHQNNLSQGDAMDLSSSLRANCESTPKAVANRKKDVFPHGMVNRSSATGGSRIPRKSPETSPI